MPSQWKPTSLSRRSSCRGPSPISTSNPPPSSSRRLALPLLPLASTVHRDGMSCLLPILNDDRRMAGGLFLQISPAAADTYNNVRGAGLRTRDDRVDNLPSAE